MVFFSQRSGILEQTVNFCRGQRPVNIPQAGPVVAVSLKRTVMRPVDPEQFN